MDPVARPFAVLIGLNLADATLTAAILTSCVGEELNPIMRAAWELSPAAFFVIKLGLAVVCGGLLLRARATGTLWALCAVFAAVVGYSVIGLL